MSKVRIHDPEGFDTFWSIWRPHMRHTDGRGKARERYRREILEGADPQDIIDGAKAYIRNHLTLPPQKQEFIPLASSWLHAESYADWCDRERVFQARQSQQQANVVPMRAKAVLPEDHFSRRWEREQKAKQG